MIQQHVTRSFGFLKTTAIGGLIFLLPLIVVGALLGQIAPVVMTVAEQLGQLLPAAMKTASGVSLLVGLAIGVLLLLCFAAGLVARWSLGRQLGEFFEKNLLLLFPRYAIIRDTMAGTIGGDDTKPQLRPVLVRFEEYTQVAFETERGTNGMVAVFLPGSPDTWTGRAVLVEEQRVQLLDVPFADAVALVEQMGRGSTGLPNVTGEGPGVPRGDTG